MRAFWLIISLIIGVKICAAADLRYDLVVVTHKDNTVDTMTHSQVIDLFMGKYVAYPNGKKATPLDINGEKTIKEAFYRQLVDLSPSRVNAYWSRIRFTGRAKPPTAKNDIEEVVDHIIHNKEAIGYIPRNELNDQLKVVFEFHE